MNINFKYKHFTTNEIKPQGWILEQLRIQAAGLSGHLDKIWPDIRDSQWIGGNREGWERVPYWLDGFIPLAYLLDDEDLKTRAKRYLDAILSRQEQDGWICPCSPEERVNYDTWAVLLICKVLVLYYECSKDERAIDAAEKAMLNLKEHLRWNTLFEWGQSRWFEGLITLYALYRRKPEKWLKELAVTFATQGLNYKRLFQCWQDQEPKREWSQQTHIVNMMMALKSEALFSSISGDDPDCFAQEMWELLETYHGSPIGYINGDECLSGTEAINGAELCSIVEAMYSFELLFEITGNTKWMDKAEKYAFNFLPATISDDMWTHQYVQMTNQIACAEQNKPPVFRTNTGEANCFGLEPHFGCCTANFNQGWPKFVLSSFYQNDDGIISAIPMPSSLDFRCEGVRVQVECETKYPFGDCVVYKIRTEQPVRFVFSIRIPECKSAKLDGKLVKSGDIIQIDRLWSNDELKLEIYQELTLVPCNNELFYLKRGTLLFAAPIDEDRKIVEYEKDGVERKFPYCDYTILPTEEWGLAFTDTKMSVDVHGITECPFSRKQPPITVDCQMAIIDWGTEENQPYVCKATPAHTEAIRYVKKTLVPYGATNLRMTVMPKEKATGL